MEAPLVLPEPRRGAACTWRRAARTGTARRAVDIGARDPRATGADGAWTRHASGTLTPAVPPAGTPPVIPAWPPPGAVPVAGGRACTSGCAAAGTGTVRPSRACGRPGGAATRCSRRSRCRADGRRGAARFGIHPALLDAALHADRLGGGRRRRPGGRRLPAIAWNGVCAVRRGRRRPAGTAARRFPAPGRGAGRRRRAAGRVGGSWSAAGVRRTARQRGRVSRRPVRGGLAFPSRGGNGACRWAVLAPTAGPGAGLAELPATYGRGPGRLADGGHARRAGAGRRAGLAARLATAARTRRRRPGSRCGRALELVQEWLDEHGCPTSRLVVVTRGAVAAMPGEGVTDLAGAAVWGLVRSAQAENPDRLVLVDLPGGGRRRRPRTRASVLAAVLAAGEPQLAVRAGRVYGRRLARRSRRADADARPSWSPAAPSWSPAARGCWAACVARHLVAGRGRTGALVLSRGRAAGGGPGRGAGRRGVAGRGCQGEGGGVRRRRPGRGGGLLGGLGAGLADRSCTRRACWTTG